MSDDDLIERQEARIVALERQRDALLKACKGGRIALASAITQLLLMDEHTKADEHYDRTVAEMESAISLCEQTNG